MLSKQFVARVINQHRTQIFKYMTYYFRNSFLKDHKTTCGDSVEVKTIYLGLIRLMFKRHEEYERLADYIASGMHHGLLYRRYFILSLYKHNLFTGSNSFNERVAQDRIIRNINAICLLLEAF